MYSNKINKRKIYHIIPVILIVLLNSCERDLTIEIKTNDKRLIVVGEFTTDSVVHTAHLYLASSLITGKPQTVVSGAHIFITNHTDTIYYTESDTIPGIYKTPGKCRGIGGQVYQLFINNTDIDNDGKKETYTASSLLPMPIQFDSLISQYGVNGDNLPAIVNLAYYKVLASGPDYVYNLMQINRNEIAPIAKRLGTGEISRGEKEYRIRKSNDQSYHSLRYFSLDKDKVKQGDTLTFIGYNFTKEQYNFLIAFDNNTEGDIFNNFQDNLRVPVNMPTNIVPEDKAVGFFMMYSISRISKVFK